MRRIMITAHTGCSNSPENTLESVQTGQNLGADINEIDIRSTSDGIPILWHDDFIVTRDNVQHKVEDIQLSEILNLQKKGEIAFTHSQSSITTLQEVFDAFVDSDIHYNLDLKDDECVTPTTELVRRYRLSDKVVFTGCGKVRASYLKSNYAEFQVLLNADEKTLTSQRLTQDERNRLICDTAVSAGCCGLNIRHDYCNSGLVDLAMSRFLPVSVWTVNSPRDFDRYIKMGVSSITTLKVRELRDRLITTCIPARSTNL